MAPEYVRLPLPETSPNTCRGRVNSASVRNRSRFRLVRGRLVRMPEGELLTLEPETRMEGIVVRALPARGRGFPNEAAALAAIPSLRRVARMAIGGLAEISKGRLTPGGAVRAGGERDRGNMQGSDAPARKHDQAPDARYGRIMAIPARATRLRLRLRGGRTR